MVLLCICQSNFSLSLDLSGTHVEIGYSAPVVDKATSVELTNISKMMVLFIIDM